MVEMKDYLSVEKAGELCRTIGLPEEAAEKALRYMDNGGCEAAAPYFESLLSRHTAAASASEVAKIWKGEDGEYADSGFGLMATFLAAALRTRELYGDAGIDLSVYYETMSFFREVLNENLILYGRYTFDRADWYHRQISQAIYKLGALEFELMDMDADFAKACGLPEGEPVLSVHIQTGSDLIANAVSESYRKALDFFPKYYPDFKYRLFLCCSWLLSPALKALLPENSKITGFASEYEVVQFDEESEGFFAYLYNIKKRPDDLGALPEDTALRRNVKKFLAGGGKIGWATGLKRI